MVGLLTRWRRAERALCRELRQAPTFEQVAKLLGLSETQKTLVVPRRAGAAAQAGERHGRRGEPAGRPRRRSTAASQPESALEAEDERASLLRRLDRLDDRERTILALRFGLEGDVPMTLKEVGRRLGVTREWVRKIELRAVRKLDDRPAETAPPRRSARRLSRRAMSPATRPQTASRPLAAASC